MQRSCANANANAFTFAEHSEGKYSGTEITLLQRSCANANANAFTFAEHSEGKYSGTEITPTPDSRGKNPHLYGDTVRASIDFKIKSASFWSQKNLTPLIKLFYTH
ncbi:hypothetical protein AFK68_17100 [Hydrocoleum sp. CS-953]|nr:hypothetical protein AFK68_17100 [Hydrocoleum sp. CS-953]